MTSRLFGDLVPQSLADRAAKVYLDANLSNSSRPIEMNGDVTGMDEKIVSWRALEDAFKAYSKNRRDVSLQKAVIDTASAIGAADSLKHGFKLLSRGECPSYSLGAQLSGLSQDQRIDLARLLFEECEPVRHASYPARANAKGDEFVEALNISALQRVGDNELVQSLLINFHREILHEKKLTIISPLTGNLISSNVALLVVAGGGRPLIFYHYIDREPFYLMIHSFSGCRFGFFFPDRDLMLTLPKEAPRSISLLKALSIEFSGRTAAHITDRGPRKLALLAGVMNHFGHSILNEYEAYAQCCTQDLFNSVDVILQGWANYFPHDALYPELADREVVRINTMVEGFLTVIDSRLMLARPSCNYWFSVELSRRMRNAARTLYSGRDTTRLDAAKGHHPLIWFEIRTNDRRWANQEHEIPKLIGRLREDFPDVGVILAGWSRMNDFNDQDERMIRDDAELASRIVERLPGVPVYDITGVSTVEKTLWAEAATTFVAMYGTGLIYPWCLSRRPGVVHTNTDYIRRLWPLAPERRITFCEKPPFAQFVAPEHITDFDPEKPHGVRSHNVGWEPVYEIIKVILDKQAQATPDA